MNWKRNMAKKSRRYNIQRIKQTHPYTLDEIAELYEIHKGTVSQWLKEGLEKIDSKRPYLIRGSELKRFLKEKQMKRKRKCREGEIFCLPCKLPQKPVQNQVYAKEQNDRQFRVIGICPKCKRIMNVYKNKSDLERMAKFFDVFTAKQEHLSVFCDRLVNLNLERNVENE